MGRKAASTIYKQTQLEQLSADQRACLTHILGKIERGGNVIKSDLDSFTDYSQLSNKKICDVLKITRKTLAEMSIKDHSIKNGNGTYSLINAVDYIRNGKGSASGDGSIEDKRVVETKILEKKLSELNEKYIERTEVEKFLVSRLERLNTYLGSTLDRDLHLLANKSLSELHPIKNDIIRKALKAYGDESVKSNK
jgi:hypothetical protein